MSLEDFDNVWAAELIFAVDAETQAILDATGDVEACLGSSPEMLVGLPLFASVHRDDAESAQAAFDRAVSEGRATWEGRVQRTDGTFAQYSWEGRLGLDGTTIYARSRDADRAREILSNLRVFERLADLTADLLIVVNNEGRIVQANQAVAKAHNAVGHDFVGTLLTDYVPEDGRRILNGIPGRLMQGESVIDFQLPALDGKGGEMIMEGTATFDQVTDRWYVVERNVTERVQKERELEITNRFFDLSTSQLILIDGDDCVLRANQAFLDVVDWRLDDVVGRDVLEALRIVGGSEIRRLLVQLREGASVDPIEVQIAVDGIRRRLEVQLSAAVDGGEVYLTCRDVTEERMLQLELLRRASRDSLTGLANRSSLLEAVSNDLQSGVFVTVLMLDLDGFKRVNDTLGHAAGDALLVSIAERLNQQTRGVDVVARMGGDEFVLLLRGVPDLPTLGLVCEKIRRAFDRPFDVLGRPVSISASIGGAGGHKSSHSADDLLAQADLAAYAAKDDGENSWRLFNDELRDQSEFASAVEEHLRRVLDAPDFDLDVVEFTQASGESIGVGVIAPAVAISGERRWNSESMSIARSLGLLGPISTRMTSEAIGHLAPWLRSRPEAFLEVVYDASELSMSGFVSVLSEMLDRHDVARSQFVVSLAGLAQMGTRAVDLETIRALRSAGIRVALAESCADAHTLSVIAAIGVDRIGVDAAHVASAAEGSVQRSIADTVLDIAERLGVEIMVDADFTPDMVDLGSVFGNCAPLGVRSLPPVPIDDFLANEQASTPS